MTTKNLPKFMTQMDNVNSKSISSKAKYTAIDSRDSSCHACDVLIYHRVNIKMVNCHEFF